LTRWWSFTVLAVIVYGLIPRVGFLLLTGWRMRAATRSVLLNDPRVAALLDRMSAPNVETRGASQEQSQAVDPLPGEVAPHAPPKGSAGAVIWGQAMSATQAAEFARARLGLSLTDIVEAGTGTLDADRETLACFAGGSDPVVVLTPAWEPPLLEFVDFLASLRANLASARSIVVVPVGEAMQEISSEEHENWNLAVRRSGDPRAYVETGDR
ncbi:MAG TPA: DUF2868 domain-containing protein, partial [Gammaproteobacteria bacterium]|nr:DUF2868 domain-containing protein [Gammaproteobacteria bacterium]